jgi:hypothetical protein
MRYSFLKYDEAKEYVMKLGFRSKLDWERWCKSGKRPSFIPGNPYNQYLYHGWENWASFLGYRKRCSYGESCIANFMEQNKIEYKQQVKLEGCKNKNHLPFDIGVYKDGELLALFEFHGQQHYISVPHWGGDEIFNRIREHDNIKEMYCCKNNILLFVLSYEYFDKLYDWLVGYFEEYLSKYFPNKKYVIPANTNTNVFKSWLSYDEAKDYVQKLNFKGVKEFLEWVKTDKKHPQIPSDPESVYKRFGWTSYSDFLGTGTIATFNRLFLSYEDCKELAQSLKLNSHDEWLEFVKNSGRSDLPLYAEATYKNEFEGYNEFLGKIQFLPFEEARDFVRSKNISGKDEWCNFTKTDDIPDNIPHYPDGVYKEQWISWGDWLGIGLLYENGYVIYEDAALFAQKLNLKTKGEWDKWVKNNNLPDNIPDNPRKTYANKGWISWKFFMIGEYKVKSDKEFVTYEEAKEIVKELQIKDKKSYNDLKLSIKDEYKLPSCPYRTYKFSGWTRWKYFLYL